MLIASLDLLMQFHMLSIEDSYGIHECLIFPLESNFFLVFAAHSKLTEGSVSVSS